MISTYLYCILGYKLQPNLIYLLSPLAELNGIEVFLSVLGYIYIITFGELNEMHICFSYLKSSKPFSVD